MDITTYIIIIAFGLVIGSFLTVCIYRIPLGRVKGIVDLDLPEEEEEKKSDDSVKSESDVVEPKVTIADPPRSFCPSCNKQLHWYHNIPVFSWLFLRGKCGLCSAPISVRYPFVELLSAISCVLSVVVFGLSPTAFLIYVFCAALIVISFIDYDYYIIPNVISIPGTVIGIVIGVINQFFGVFHAPVASGIIESGAGLLLGGGFLLIISEFYIRVRKKVGLGVGDIKLLAMTGAFFGPEAALYTIFVGSLLGTIFGVAIILIQRQKVSHPIPFGPYLAAGTFLYLFVGVELIVKAREFVMMLCGLGS